MYYKSYTNNGDFHLGYLYNITNPEEIRKFFLWEAENQFESEEISEEEYEEMKSKIKNLNLQKLLPKADGDEASIDGFVETLYVTASSTPFSLDDIEESQKGSVGWTPWN